MVSDKIDTRGSTHDTRRSDNISYNFREYGVTHCAAIRSDTEVCDQKEGVVKC